MTPPLDNTRGGDSWTSCNLHGFWIRRDGHWKKGYVGKSKHHQNMQRAPKREGKDICMQLAALGAVFSKPAPKSPPKKPTCTPGPGPNPKSAPQYFPRNNPRNCSGVFMKLFLSTFIRVSTQTKQIICVLECSFGGHCGSTKPPEHPQGVWDGMALNPLG